MSATSRDLKSRRRPKNLGGLERRQRNKAQNEIEISLRHNEPFKYMKLASITSTEFLFILQVARSKRMHFVDPIYSPSLMRSVSPKQTRPLSQPTFGKPEVANEPSLYLELVNCSDFLSVSPLSAPRGMESIPLLRENME